MVKWIISAVVPMCIMGLFLLSTAPHTTQVSNPQDAPNEITTYSSYTLIANVPYGTESPQQSYDLYVPVEAKNITPLVAYMHGGGWTVGDKRIKNDIVAYYARYFAERGIAFASLNYRLAPRYHYPKQNYDIDLAMKHLVEEAAQYNIDTNHTFMFGDSAGGLLAMMYALGNKAPEPAIKGVISFYGTTDLVHQLNRKVHSNDNAKNYLGNASESLARQASPLYQTITTPPPFLFFHGSNDTMVSIAQARALYDKVKVAQPTSEFVTVSNAGHYFTEASSPKASEIRTKVTEFIAKHTGISPDPFAPSDTLDYSPDEPLFLFDNELKPEFNASY